MFGISSAVEQGDVFQARHLQNRLPGFRLDVEFGKVTAAELFPFRRIVLEPVTQDIAGGFVLYPAFSCPSVACGSEAGRTVYFGCWAELFFIWPRTNINVPMTNPTVSMRETA